MIFFAQSFLVTFCNRGAAEVESLDSFNIYVMSHSPLCHLTSTQ